MYTQILWRQGLLLTFLLSLIHFPLLAQSFTVDSWNVINVSSYGAIPDDGIDDEDAINAAIAAAGDNAIIRFEAGVYTLRAPDSRFTNVSIGHITVDDKKDITLEGAVMGGEPATHIERLLEFPIPSGVIVPSVLSARRNDGLKIINITFDNKNYHYAVGRVVSINAAALTVEVLPGYPVDDNCPNTAANVWTWDGSPNTQEELKVGEESLSYSSIAGNWQVVSGRQMTLQKNYDQAVDVGDYISWHYGTASAGAVNIRVNKRVHIENVHIYNSLRSCLFYAYCQDIYTKDVEIRSKDGRFATCPRDGIHSSRNIGEYIVDNLYVKGTRLDGFVAAGTAATVESKIDNRTFRFETDQSLGGGSSFGSTFGDGNGGNQSGMVCLVRPIYFFENNGTRHKVETQSVKWHANATGTVYEVTTSEDLPPFVQVNTVLSPGGLTSDTVLVQNSRFVSIAGSGQVLFCDNSASLNNTYENLMYAAIRLGANPTRNHAGINHRVANSTFTDCAWRINLNNPTNESNEYGYINSFNANTQGRGFENMDVANILIEDNDFTSHHPETGTGPGRAGIIIDEAYDIVITGNTFSGITVETEMRDVHGNLEIDNDNLESGFIYRLENLQNNLYLRGYDPNASNASGNDAYVTVFDDRPTWSTQKWVITAYPSNPDRYEIKNIYSDRVLRGYDPGSSNPTSSETKVTVRDPTAWSTMMWEFIRVGSEADVYYIKNNYSGLYLKAASTANEYATQTSDNSSLNTQWKLTTDSASLIDEEFTVGIDQPKGALRIYPNPAKKHLQILDTNLKGSYIELWNLSGKKVLQTSIPTESPVTLELEGISSGIYLLYIHKREGNTDIRRVILE